MSIRGENFKMVGKLAVITAGMFGFGYAMIPLYKTICEISGINILAQGEFEVPGNATRSAGNSQVDLSRTITVEEFKRGILNHNISMTPDEVLQLFKLFDDDGSGHIDFNEFISDLRVSAGLSAPH